MHGFWGLGEPKPQTLHRSFSVHVIESSALVVNQVFCPIALPGQTNVCTALADLRNPLASWQLSQGFDSSCCCCC